MNKLELRQIILRAATLLAIASSASWATRKLTTTGLGTARWTALGLPGLGSPGNGEASQLAYREQIHQAIYLAQAGLEQAVRWLIDQETPPNAADPNCSPEAW